MRRVGNLTIHLVSDGNFLLDGGAMFGVVPRPMWMRMRRPDEKNRIPIAMNSLLIRSEEGWTALIDTGMGDKWDDRMRGIFGLTERDRLIASVRACGVEPEEITHVLLTHLHLDHAGGNTLRDPDGSLRPAFPNALHVIQRSEWRDALSDHPALRESYVADDLLPIEKAGLVDFIEGDTEVLPGVRACVTGGHTPGHQIFLIGEGPGSIAYLADLFPTTHHLKPHYHMAYDLDPMIIAERRIEWADRLVEENRLCVFEHDAETVCGRMTRNETGRLGIRPEPL